MFLNILSFFHKKVLFINIWSGTPEMHCHVLPGIDDGPKNKIESLNLLEKYAQLGCKRIIATPHTMNGIYNNTIHSIKKAFESVPNIPEIKLTYSSEYMLDDNFNNLLEEDLIIPLKDKYILIEMSYMRPPENLYELIYKLKSKGYMPILAHPERYKYYHDKYHIYSELKRKGCLLQLNALALTPHYGNSCQRVAFKLLKEGLYDFIGVDAHKIDHLEKIETMKLSKQYKNRLTDICSKTTKVFSS
ncbi:tyrosine-protein phosphatase [uncultured Dokdonia sp.]|uniref:tyrosine-protein phosphatase n=1 Tax=unclassified Dokdonia TaxID=2615033 RepID=UPI0026310F12|nr:CpsB/CapC family capsule biosynthesis tyrosine phosphatase [uncultured Dokdonia sp.]